MADGVRQRLEEDTTLYGVICRDPTITDLELFAHAGYDVVWMDLEHGAISTMEAGRLCRTIEHLGMVPMARIIELTRAQVQSLLDSGFRIILLPGVIDAPQAERLVELAKYPPIGRRGVSTCSASTGFRLGDDPLRTLAETNQATHLMVQFEDDTGYRNREAILDVPGIDMVTVGPMDWSVSLGLMGDEANQVLAPRIRDILNAARDRGKTTAIGVSNIEEASTYTKLGVRILFVGVDVALKREAYISSLKRYQDAAGG